MKNKSGSRLGRFFGRIVKPREWGDTSRLMTFTQYIGQLFKTLFIPQKQAGGETFEAATSRLQLTEEALLARQNALYRWSLAMCGCAFLIFIYAIYHLIFGTLHAFILSLVIMCIALTMAFRYHFWFFQLKQRKLGCTLKEWFKQGLLGEKS
jgi:intracellular multiplication protein IcmV